MLLRHTPTEGKAGTEAGISAFASQDGKRIGFLTTDDKLKTVPMDGGLPSTVTSLFRFTRAIWTLGGEIIADTSGNGLVRIADGGRKPVDITRVDEAHGESRHASPVLDGAGNVLFTVVRSRGGPGTVIGDIAVAPLDAKSNVQQPHHAVGVSGRQIVAFVDGLLLYVSGEGASIVAVTYDGAAGKTTGKPTVRPSEYGRRHRGRVARGEWHAANIELPSDFRQSHPQRAPLRDKPYRFRLELCRERASLPPVRSCYPLGFHPPPPP